MRGNPFIQTVIVIVVFLLAGVPTYRLTRPAEAQPPSEPSAPELPTLPPAMYNVVVTFGLPPAEFSITNLGKPVLTGQGPQDQFTGWWSALIPPEGVDLVVHARWPANADANATPDARTRGMRVAVCFPGGASVEKSFWAADNGEVDDVLTVPRDPAPIPP